MEKRTTEQPSADDLWTLLREQRDALLEQRDALQKQQDKITRLEALVDHQDHHVAGAENHKANPAGQAVSRLGLLKAAAMGAAGVVGAGTLLQHGAGVAGATGAEGQTTFSSATTTPTVTVTNSSTGLAIKASGSIQSSKGVTAKTVTATNPSTAASANAVVGQISSTSPGSLSAGVRGQNLSTAGNGYGVYGSHSGTGTAVYGEVSGAGYGGTFVASNTGGVGVSGTGEAGVKGVGTGYGGDFSGATAVYGNGANIGGAFYGVGGGNQGVYASGATNAYGLYANSEWADAIYATTQGADGVYAYSSNGDGNGVLGVADGAGSPCGVWGSAPSNGYALYATGNFAATGTKNAIVPAADGSHRKLYCMESPECWFEDFGSAQLVNGHASVTIDPVFAGVVHTDLFHIFLTAKGDSKGLYVSAQSAGGFEVREQEGGKSSLTFSYRVVAKRKDVVAPRLEQVTIKEPPAPQVPRILPKPTPKKPVLDPNPDANVVQDPTA